MRFVEPADAYSQWLYIIEGVRIFSVRPPDPTNADLRLQSITMLVGIIIVFVLPDFPQTWRLLSPELKHVANRRLAIDAAEADVDEPGGMSMLTGLKLCFTDPKVLLPRLCCSGTDADLSGTDLPHRRDVSLRHWCHRLPELLPDAH